MRQANDYAETISRFDIAIAGCRQYHQWLWPVAKHFEIMAAGTAMITDEACAPFLEPLGLVDRNPLGRRERHAGVVSREHAARGVPARTRRPCACGESHFVSCGPE